MAKKKVIECSTTGCDRPMFYKESGLCKACYAFYYYWKGRSVTAQVKRNIQLHQWVQRFEDFMSRTGNIRPMKRRKAS